MSVLEEGDLMRALIEIILRSPREVGLALADARHREGAILLESGDVVIDRKVAVAFGDPLDGDVLRRTAREF
jgi:hypothetical protein